MVTRRSSTNCAFSSTILRLRPTQRLMARLPRLTLSNGYRYVTDVAMRGIRTFRGGTQKRMSLLKGSLLSSQLCLTTVTKAPPQRRHRQGLLTSSARAWRHFFEKRKHCSQLNTPRRMAETPDTTHAAGSRQPFSEQYRSSFFHGRRYLIRICPR